MEGGGIVDELMSSLLDFFLCMICSCYGHL